MKIFPIGLTKSSQQYSDDANRVLSEPNTVSDWGKEKQIQTPSKLEVWEGQFGTRRYIHRDEQGLIDGALLVGRRTKKDKWQELLLHTRKDKRRQGIATLLNNAAVKDNGELADASEYSPDGQSFKSSVRLAQTIYRGDEKPVNIQDFDAEYGIKMLGKELGSAAAMGPGIYFASHENIAKGYGSNITKKVLNNANILNHQSPRFTSRQIEKILSGVEKEKLETAVSNWDENFNIGKKQLIASITDADNPIDQLMNIWAEVFYHQNPNAFMNLMAINGIDGISVTRNDVTFFVVYNKNSLND